MLVPVGILAVLAVIGGWIQFAPFWHPLTNWLEPVAQTLAVAEPKNWQEALSSVLAVGLGLAGIGVAWAMYGTGSVAVPRLPALQRVLEHKFYFDEAYDRLFYAPTVALANYLRGTVEDEWILPAGSEFASVTLESGRIVRRLQTGLLRTYVLVLGSGMAVVAIVFLLVK
jgi:NADH-quinone oxidoreductase subunit L